MRESALVSNDKFLIESSDIELAKDVCNSIDAPKTRNRAVANALAAGVSKKYFTDIEVDTDSGLHNIPFVLNKIDISDIYINDAYVDVRVYFNDNELCVPKSHFDMGLLPVAYMFVKIDSELSGGIVTGFISASSVDTSEELNGYYKVSEDNLVSYYDIEDQLVSDIIDEPNDFDNQIFDYLDGRLKDENEFYKVLLKSRYCRNQLKNAANVQSIMRGIAGVDLSPKQDLLQDTESDNFEELQLDEAIESDELDLDISSDSLLEPVENDEAMTLSFEPVQESVVDTIEEVSEGDLLIVENDSDLDSFEENLNVELEPVKEDVLTEESFNVEVPEKVEPFIDAEDSVTVESVEIDNFEQVEEEPESSINEESIPDSVLDNEGLVEVNDEYTTNVTPSLETVEEVVTVDDLEEMLDNDKSVFDEVAEQPQAQSENSQQIEDLFESELETEESINQTMVSPNKKSGMGLLFLLALIIVGALGYFGYTKFSNQEATIPEQTDSTNVVVNRNDKTPLPVQDAMPIETVENVPTQNSSEEAVSATIPAIEQNLDASILVSNLSVNWEVPAGYITNNTAKRYFTKVGKIIQLNLKADLLLLSKPPITNKIMVELEYNKDASKFAVKGITASSGEKAVDDLIIKVVNSALDINLKTNMNTFVNIAGNPVLIIRL